MAHSNRNSPHLSTHLNGSAPSSPSMSNAQSQQQQQPAGQPRQPAGYPSPTSYPSPSLSGAQYNYPPPNNQQQQQQQHLGSQLPPPVAQMGGSYYHNQAQNLPPPSQYPNVTSDPIGPNMRYALPVTDSRVMSGGRHKKEIKRRTKTGCLTCRKRRIKCDEQHPACRNCQKSKRECLGYDPIFKQAPGPAAIQPAPSSAPSMSSAAATANPYGNQPQMLGGAYAPVSSMAYEPALSAGVNSPGSAGQQFEYASAIDPALEAAAPPTTAAAGNSYGGQPAKRTVGDLLDMGGPSITTAGDAPQTAASSEEINHLYFSVYAPGLESFLESKWFSTKGLTKLASDKSLLEQFSGLIAAFSKANAAPATEAAAAMASTAGTEARIVWALATMVRSSAAEANGAGSGLVPAVDDPVEAAHRLAVFEALLTGRVAGSNPLTQPVAGSTDHHRLRELEFWYTMGNFVCLAYEDPAGTKDIDDALSALRNLLDGRENRDVLYSIAVVRALSQRVSEYTEGEQPLHLDESDNKSKLLVAKRFVTDEGAGNGTTNVIRRLCGLASRTWPPIPPTAVAK